MKPIILSYFILFTICGFGQNIDDETKTKFFRVKDASNNAEFVLFFTDNKAIFKVYKNDYGVCTDGNCKVYFEFNEMKNGKRISHDMYNWDKFNCKGDYSIGVDSDTSESPFTKKGDLPSYQLYKKLSTLTLYAVIFETETTYKYPLVRVYVDKKNSIAIKNEVLKTIVRIKTIDTIEQIEHDTSVNIKQEVQLNTEMDTLKKTEPPKQTKTLTPEVSEVATEDKHKIVGRTLSIVVYLHIHKNFTKRDSSCSFYMVENEPYFSTTGGLNKNEVEILLSTMIALKNKMKEKSTHDVKTTITGSRKVYATASYKSKSGKWNGSLTIDYRTIEMSQKNLNKLIPVVEKAISMMY